LSVTCLPPRERGKWQGVTGAISGLSSILGPAVGGFLTENISWRWVFSVNLPIGIVALLVLIFLMPDLRGNVKQARIDYPGALLLVVAVVPLLLGFTWAGHQYAWNSPQIIGLFIGSTVFFVLFFVYEAFLERRDLQPILDPSLFKNGIFDISITMSMIIGVSMFGSIFFLPLLAQGVMGISATNSGILLSPMMLALIFGTTTSGQLVSRTGKYKWLVILSAVMSLVGSLLFLRLGVHSSANDLWMSMIVLGLGIGFGIALYTVIIQNALPGKIGQATSALTFFRQIAATIALAAMGSLMTSAYVPAFHDALSPQVKQFAATMREVRHVDLLRPFENPNILLSDEAKVKAVQSFQPLPGGMQIYDQLISAVKVGLSHGIHDIFILDFCFSVAGFLLVWFLKEIPLRGGKKQSKAGAMAQEREAVEGGVRSVPLL
jgi:predicted MFS family arabinose efflux permease